MSSTEAALSLQGLSKFFRSHWTFRQLPAVSDVNLSVERGELFGFLGHNGAGKTTTIKCITGLIRPSAGRILLNGSEISGAANHQQLGYLPEQPYFYDHLSVLETLEFFAALYGLVGTDAKRAVHGALERVGLGGRAKQRVRALSKGLQQRLGFAQAILHRPALLILDEPFSGLDPIGRKEMRELIVELNRQGTTIFMSSHVLGDVEQICHRVSIMARGKMQALFNLADSRQLFGEMFELQLRAAAELVPELAATAHEHSRIELASGTVERYRFADPGAALAALDRARQAGAEILLFERQSRGLEEIFIQVTAQAGGGAADVVLGDNR